MKIKLIERDTRSNGVYSVDYIKRKIDFDGTLNEFKKFLYEFKIVISGGEYKISNINKR